MNKTKIKRNDELFSSAEEVFSKGYMDYLSLEGLDLIEQEAFGSRLSDSSGNEYLDCFTSAGTFNLGRAREELFDSLREAARQTDQGNFVAISEEKALLANQLAGFMPGKLDCTLFTVVRGEAIDAACKLARGFTGRSEIITFEGGWYGQTGFAASLTSHGNQELFGPEIPDIYKIPFGDIDAAKKAVNRKTAGLVMETVQTENGCIIADKEYYTSLRELCNQTGTILIIDESQTGFGRTGKRFSFELFGIEPDIAVLGEAITGGMFPMTAITFTRRLKSFFDDHPLIHLCTFGGHDVGCNVAMKALELYIKEKPWEHAHVIGDDLLGDLREIAIDNSQILHNVQGVGLLLSIILNNEENARRFCVEAKKNGLICTRGLVNKRSVLFRPVLSITIEEGKKIVNCTEKIIKKL